jgi:hypothetical protein
MTRKAEEEAKPDGDKLLGAEASRLRTKRAKFDKKEARSRGILNSKAARPGVVPF